MFTCLIVAVLISPFSFKPFCGKDITFTAHNSNEKTNELKMIEYDMHRNTIQGKR